MGQLLTHALIVKNALTVIGLNRNRNPFIVVVCPRAMSRTYRNHYFSPLDRRIRVIEADCILSDKANNRIRSRIHANDDLRHA